MKLTTHVLLVHRYVKVKNTHGKYVPSELDWFNNENATDTLTTAQELKH